MPPPEQEQQPSKKENIQQATLCWPPPTHPYKGFVCEMQKKSFTPTNCTCVWSFLSHCQLHSIISTDTHNGWSSSTASTPQTAVPSSAYTPQSAIPSSSCALKSVIQSLSGSDCVAVHQGQGHTRGGLTPTCPVAEWRLWIWPCSCEGGEISRVAAVFVVARSGVGGRSGVWWWWWWWWWWLAGSWWLCCSCWRGLKEWY